MHWDGRITEKVETKDKEEDKDQENKDIENKDKEEDKDMENKYKEEDNENKDKEEDKDNKDNVLEMVTPMLLTRTQTTRLFITRLRQRNVSLESENFHGLEEKVLICLVIINQKRSCLCF